MKMHKKTRAVLVLHPHAVQDSAEGQGDVAQYYFVPAPRRLERYSSAAESRRQDGLSSAAEPLRQYRHSRALRDDSSSDISSQRPHVLTPRYYRPLRNRRLPSKLCLPVASRPEPRRRHSKPLPLIDLSEDLDSFLSLYDDEAKHRGQDQARVPYASLQQFVPRHPARPRRRGFSAPLTVPTGIPLPRLPRKLARRSEIPLRRGRPVFLQAADQEMEESAPGARGREVSSSKAYRTGALDNLPTMNSDWYDLKHLAEVSEIEDSRQLAPKTTSNSSNHQTPVIPSRLLKQSRLAAKKCKPARNLLPKPRRSKLTSSDSAWLSKLLNPPRGRADQLGKASCKHKQDTKLHEKTPSARSSDSEILSNLLRDLKRRFQAYEIKETVRQQETPASGLVSNRTESESGKSKSIVTSNAASVIPNSPAVQEEPASRSSGYVQLDKRQVIEADNSGSSTSLDPRLTLDAPACKGFVMLPKEPERIKTLKQLQRDHLMNIQREAKRLLVLQKYVEEHVGTHSTPDTS
ncbi:uncharacterized protein LOC134527120 isoform X1 [Bacillus rossius redtenbacheri]|uniref:uncharacterized protein LOC134527120 isoform X1 n=1 Tax=Bacillus rossius redtenbacheri TaxID=93214 RepID=UPI002FDDAFF1